MFARHHNICCEVHILFAIFLHRQPSHPDVGFALTDGKHDRIEVHVADDQLFAEMFGEFRSDLHIHAVIVIALRIFKRLKGSIRRYDQLILAVIQLADSRLRFPVAKVIVQDLVQMCRLFDLCDKCVHLFKQFRLILVYAKRIFFLSQRNVDDFYSSCCRTVCIVPCAASANTTAMMTAKTPHANFFIIILSL